MEYGSDKRPEQPCAVNAHGKRRMKKNAHVIVCGNEKGGSGKTTTSMHIVVSLLKAGFKVATIDLDARQQSLTRYVQNRHNWSHNRNANLEIPSHFRIDPAQVDSAIDAQSKDFFALIEAVSKIEHQHDFLVIDTPGADGYLMRLAHSMADTLVTPMNDSFVDFDVLGHVNSDTLEVEEVSHYAMMVRDARRQRRAADNGLLDWIVVRNRMSSLVTHNQQNLMKCVQELSMRLGFRVADGIGERMIFREYFPTGLTALDDLAALEIMKEGRTSASHEAARTEVSSLMRTLRLPIDETGRKRARARKTWLKATQEELAIPDIFAE